MYFFSLLVGTSFVIFCIHKSQPNLNNEKEYSVLKMYLKFIILPACCSKVTTISASPNESFAIVQQWIVKRWLSLCKQANQIDSIANGRSILLSVSSVNIPCVRYAPQPLSLNFCATSYPFFPLCLKKSISSVIFSYFKNNEFTSRLISFASFASSLVSS